MKREHSRPLGRLQENAKAQRERILNAAFACFAWSGYAGTTIADIARRAGLSHGLVHHYFKSKADLYVAALEEGLAYFNRVRDAALAAEVPPEERLRRWVWGIARGLQDAFLYTRLLMQVNGAPGIHPRRSWSILLSFASDSVSTAAGILHEAGVPEAEAKERAILALSNLVGARFLIIDTRDPHELALRMYRTACAALGIAAEPVPMAMELPPPPAWSGDLSPWQTLSRTQKEDTP